MQSFLLLACGALTASFAEFTGSKSISFDRHSSILLGFSWWSLVTSIYLAIVVLKIVLLRDYALGELWQKSFLGASIAVSETPGKTDFAIIVLGVILLLEFLSGLFLLHSWKRPRLLTNILFETTPHRCAAQLRR